MTYSRERERERKGKIKGNWMKKEQQYLANELIRQLFARHENKGAEAENATRFLVRHRK